MTRVNRNSSPPLYFTNLSAHQVWKYHKNNFAYLTELATNGERILAKTNKNDHLCSFCPFGGDFPGIHFSYRCVSIVEPKNPHKNSQDEEKKNSIECPEKIATPFFVSPL